LVRVIVDARMTDRESDGVPAVTGIDTPIGVNMPCTPTPGDPAGSTCEVATSMDALIPGSVVEKRRTLLQLGAIRVLDGSGPGADTLATQGVFVP
jgi:hypothetical protein